MAIVVCHCCAKAVLLHHLQISVADFAVLFTEAEIMAMNNHHEMEIPGFIPVQKRDSLGKAHLAGPSDDINLPSKPGRSGPELIASIPDPTLEGYIARFNADNIEETFQQVGIPVKQPRTSVFGVGHAVKPGTIDFAMRDGLLYVLLPGKHAYRCHGLQPRPYVVERTISFSEDAASRASGYCSCLV